MTDSSVTYNKNGDAVCFDGPDAVNLFRAAALAASLGLFKAGMRTRHMSATQALAECTKYTGKKYKRGEYDRAKADMTIWIQTMKAALPVNVRGGE